jgi:hypothetical protein
MASAIPFTPKRQLCTGFALAPVVFCLFLAIDASPTFYKAFSEIISYSHRVVKQSFYHPDSDSPEC